VEGQALRDSADDFAQLGTVILGASFDTVAENLAFATHQEFPFRLLSDRGREVGEAYGVARPADEPYADYPRRWSFLIDPAGVVRVVYDVTDVAAHAGDVLTDLRSFGVGP
jgi:peroxiredoxin